MGNQGILADACKDKRNMIFNIETLIKIVHKSKWKQMKHLDHLLIFNTLCLWNKKIKSSIVETQLEMIMEENALHRLLLVLIELIMGMT